MCHVRDERGHDASWISPRMTWFSPTDQNCEVRTSYQRGPFTGAAPIASSWLAATSSLPFSKFFVVFSLLEETSSSREFDRRPQILAESPDDNYGPRLGLDKSLSSKNLFVIIKMSSVHNLENAP